MKDFLKYTLATITGIVVILLIVFFSGLIILFRHYRHQILKLV